MCPAGSSGGGGGSVVPALGSLCVCAAFVGADLVVPSDVFLGWIHGVQDCGLGERLLWTRTWIHVVQASLLISTLQLQVEANSTAKCFFHSRLLSEDKMPEMNDLHATPDSESFETDLNQP